MSLIVRIYKKMHDFKLDVSFETGEDCMGLLGASGSGKSMTLKCICGIEKPDHGYIELNGRVLFDSERKINLKPQVRRVGYLFQQYALFPNMTVSQNIACAYQGVKQHKCKAVAEQLELFQLSELEERYPHELSGGQQQRAALARIFIYQPEIILLDEPFSAQDGYLRDKLQMELLETLEQYSGGAVLVSHDRDEIYKLCKDMTVLSEGKSLMTGRVKEIFASPMNVAAARLTGCKNISSIKRLSSNSLYACDWGITLTTEQSIDDNIKYVGIRAHDLLPAALEDENTIPIEKAGYAETPFERQYLFRKTGNQESDILWWVIKKETSVDIIPQMPVFMTFPKEKLMLLR